MFQRQVPLYQAPAQVGDFASMNPVQVVDAGPGGLTAGANGVAVGRFAWNTYSVAGGPGVANNNAGGVPSAPAGFVANEQQALITVYLANATLIVPAGLPITEYDRGDFWANSVYSEAVIDNKVFANLFSGEVLAAATGSFPTTDTGSAASVTASGTIGTFSLVVSAVASGVLAVGQLVTGEGVPDKTYIESQTSGSAGSTGTYELSQKLLSTISSETVLLSSPEGNGGGVVVASASTGSTTVTIASVTSGKVYAGQKISGTGVPTGAYISALGTFTNTAGTGTITISSATTATITSGTLSCSSWIETPWYVKSAGNVGDLIKIGIKN